MKNVIQILQCIMALIIGVIMLYVFGAIYKYGLPIAVVSTKMFITVVGGSFFSFIMVVGLQNSHDKLRRSEAIASLIEKEVEKGKKEENE